LVAPAASVLDILAARVAGLTDRISRGRKVNFLILPGIMVCGEISTPSSWPDFSGRLIAYMAGWLWDHFFNRENLDPEVIKKLAGTFVVSLIASLINPFGWHTWRLSSATWATNI